MQTGQDGTAVIDDYVSLYREAFDKFGTMALWNKKRLDHPETGHALLTARALRIEGDMAARRLAERIEQACRAAVYPESYVAGSTPLTRNTHRYSTDIDIFHDRQERVSTAAFQHAALLEANG